MPYENENERVADVEGESPLCWESEGILRPETTFDLHTGCFEAMPLSELWSKVAPKTGYCRLMIRVSPISRNHNASRRL